MRRSNAFARWIPRFTWTLSPLAASAVVIVFLDIPSWSRMSSWGLLALVLMSYPLFWCLMWLFVEGPVKALHRRGKLNLLSYSLAAAATGLSLGVLGLMGHGAESAFGVGPLTVLALGAVAALASALPLWWFGNLGRELEH